MSEHEAAYMINALAEGRALTESGVNQMIHVENCAGEPEPEKRLWVPLDEAQHQVDTLTAYIETLERAVLASWERDTDADMAEPEGGVECQHCEAQGYHAWTGTTGYKFGGTTHASDCIVPALIAKYPDG